VVKLEVFLILNFYQIKY